MHRNVGGQYRKNWPLERRRLILQIVAAVVAIVAAVVAIATNLIVITRTSPLAPSAAPPPAPSPAGAVELHFDGRPRQLAGGATDWVETSGSVRGIAPETIQDYRIVLYSFTWDPDGANGFWYVQPFTEQCETPITRALSWRTHIHGGVQYAALLVKLPHESARACLFPARVMTLPVPQDTVVTWVTVSGWNRSGWTLGGALVAVLLMATIWLLLVLGKLRRGLRGMGGGAGKQRGETW